MAIAPTAGKIDLDAALHALGSPQRREVLRMLSTASPASASCCSSEDVCACEISKHLGISAPTTSHHMSVLRDAGLVCSRKDGLWVHYTLNRDALRQVAEGLQNL